MAALSQRSIVNLNDIAEFDYAFINHYLSGDGSTGPVSNDFNTGTVWPALIDANGWPNAAGVSGNAFGGSVRIPDPANYGGSGAGYSIGWQGSGRTNLGIGTWSELNLVAPGTATFTNASASIGFTNSFSAGQEVVFTTSNTLPAGFSLNTVYYVSPIGLSGSAFQVTSSVGGVGTPITATSAGSGTQTVNGTYLKNANGRWTNTFDTINPHILANVSGLTGPQLINISFQLTDPHSTGNYLKNFVFCRQGDQADLSTGLVFRTPFKQQVANLCPSAIRTMNWSGYSGATACRFENRTLPTLSGGYGSGNDWTASPVYASGATGTNQYTQATAFPTVANPKTTPASMLHGEIATIRITNATVRNVVQANPTGSLISISATGNGITNNNPGVITTAAPHGYSTGDIIVPVLSLACGMPQLNLFPVTINVTSTTQFQMVGVDTTSFGTYVHTAGDGVLQNFTLQVGSGNDRTSYPLVNIDGNTLSSQFSNYSAGSYFTFSFDKNCAPVTDGSFGQSTGSISGFNLTLTSGAGFKIGQTIGGGTIAGGTKIVGGSGTAWVVNISQNVASTTITGIGWVYGAWIVRGGANLGMVPLEIITTLINEINALGPAQPIGLWINIPFRALNTLDPDYTAQSDFALNAISTILNGANGYAGLTANAKLYVEYSNETWNFGGGFWASRYLWGRGYRRWFPSGTTNAIDMQLLLSTNIKRSIAAANPGSRIKYILGGWGDQGVAAFGGNLNRINGSSTPGQAGYWFGIDPVSSSWGAPMTNYEAFGFATYMEPSATYENTTTGTGTFTDDSAMFNGTDNSANSGGNYSGAANTVQAITNFVTATSSFAIDNWVDPTLTTGKTVDFATAVRPYGKTAINYEGGEGWTITTTALGGWQLGSHTVTVADAAFLFAAVNSTQWATAQVGYFNRAAQVSNTAMQAIYTTIGSRWSYTPKDTYQGGVEGAALANSPVLAAMGARNRALIDGTRTFILTT